jgi:thiol:disulfide interchange protein
MPEIIYDIKSMQEFAQLLQDNPGQLILKFEADWCVPCGKIKEYVATKFEQISTTLEHVQCVVVDVDESFEVYAYLKTKKMLNGIPALLMYRKGNTQYTYDESVSGTKTAELDAFFERCLH